MFRCSPRRIILILLLLATDTARGQAPDVPVNTIRMGLWRAVVTVPGGELPFHFELSQSPDSIYSAQLVNGEERVKVDEVRIQGGSLTLSLTAFDSRIAATLDGDVLKGSLRLTKRGGKLQVMPLTARHGEAFRFFRDGEPPLGDVSGRWAVIFSDDQGGVSGAVGEFRQDSTSLHGTFRTSTGDYRYLAGEVRGAKLYMSCFDGGHAFLFTAELTGDDTLEGHFWSGTAWHERWTATRDDTADLPDPNELTYLEAGYDRFDFTFPDLDGRDVSLSDDIFRGKVVIVALAGSWCPNCHDEAAFLSEYYRKNRDRGVEVVSLMYEHFKDFERAARQIERFRRRYDITYHTLFAGYSDKKAAAETLPMLNHVLAYPTTIFVDKRGKVRRIHTGFEGPGTGKHYEALKADFITFVDELLEE